jgi:hypothetical protein
MLLKGRQDLLIRIRIGGPLRAKTHMGFHRSGIERRGEEIAPAGDHVLTIAVL